MSNVSTILDLPEYDDTEDTGDTKDYSNLDLSNTSVILGNYSIPEELRLKSLMSSPDPLEHVNKLCSEYSSHGLSMIRLFLIAICKKTEIDSIIKGNIIETLLENSEPNEEIFDLLKHVCENMESANSTFQITVIKKLGTQKQYKEIVMKSLLRILRNEKLDEKYRYRTLFSFKNCKEHEELLREGCCAVLNENFLSLSLKILCAQYLTGLTLENETEIAEKFLLEISEDETKDYNIRADSTDILLKSKNSEIREKAILIMRKLGKSEKKRNDTLYDNKQNVHSEEIESSSQEIIDFLYTFDTMRYKNQETKQFLEIDFDYVKKALLTSEAASDYKSAEATEKIQGAFVRIEFDNKIYGKNLATLKGILLKLYTFIYSHESRKELEKRLLQELCDMADTCSTGFMTRFANTISGFCDLSLRISWREQITANFSARLNSRITKCDNFVIRDAILAELSEEDSDQKRFRKFLRENLLSIREELYEEFKKHISDTDFDLYFKAAVQSYNV